MDDFLIYAKTEEEHDRRVKEVLARLQENRLAVSPDKMCVENPGSRIPGIHHRKRRD